MFKKKLDQGNQFSSKACSGRELWGHHESDKGWSDKGWEKEYDSTTDGSRWTTKEEYDDNKMGGQESDEEIMSRPKPPSFPPPTHIREDGAPTIDSEEINLVMDALQAQYQEDEIRRHASNAAEGSPEGRAVIGLAPQPKRKVRIRAGKVGEASRLKGALAQLGVNVRR